MSILDNATGSNDGESRQNAEKYFDLFLSEFPAYSSHTIDQVINNKFPAEPMFSILHGCSYHLRELLEQRGYVEYGTGGNSTYRLTQEGRAAKAAGGHEKYLGQLETERQKLTQPHTSYVVTGNNNAVGNTHSSFDKSFNAEASKSEPTKKSKITVESIVKVIGGLITIALAILKAFGVI